MKKLAISLTILCLLIFNLPKYHAISNAKTNDYSLGITGKVFKHIPEKNWENKNSVQNGPAHLIIQKFSVSNNKLQFDGEIHAGSRLVASLKMNKNSILKNGAQNETDFLIDGFKQTDQFQIVRMAIFSKVTDSNLLLNKSLAGNKVIQLVGLDRNTRNVYVFEKNFTDDDFIGKAVKKINSTALKQSTGDLWGYRLVQASEIEVIEKKEINFTTAAESTKTLAKDSKTYMVLMRYDFGFGTETHRTEVRYHANLSSNYTLVTGLSIDFEDSNGPSGKTKNSWIEAGTYSTPVKLNISIPKTNTDHISHYQWDHNGKQREQSKDLSLSLSAGYGPASGGTSKTISYKINEGKLVDIYKSDDRYIRDTTISFKDTALSNKGHSYSTVANILNLGANKSRTIKITYTVPFYEPHYNRIFKTQPLTLTLSYK